MIDFRPYLEEGFFVTRSNTVIFEYEPIGYVESVVYSGEDKGSRIENKYKKEFEKSYITTTKWRNATSEDAMKALVERCKQAGANGLIDIRFEVLTDSHGNKRGTYASGMAIKRK